MSQWSLIFGPAFATIALFTYGCMEHDPPLEEEPVAVINDQFKGNDESEWSQKEFDEKEFDEEVQKYSKLISSLCDSGSESQVSASGEIKKHLDKNSKRSASFSQAVESNIALLQTAYFSESTTPDVKDVIARICKGKNEIKIMPVESLLEKLEKHRIDGLGFSEAGHWGRTYYYDTDRIVNELLKRFPSSPLLGPAIHNFRQDYLTLEAHWDWMQKEEENESTNKQDRRTNQYQPNVFPGVRIANPTGVRIARPQVTLKISGPKDVPEQLDQAVDKIGDISPTEIATQLNSKNPSVVRNAIHWLANSEKLPKEKLTEIASRVKELADSEDKFVAFDSLIYQVKSEPSKLVELEDQLKEGLKKISYGNFVVRRSQIAAVCKGAIIESDDDQTRLCALRFLNIGKLPDSHRHASIVAALINDDNVEIRRLAAEVLEKLSEKD